MHRLRIAVVAVLAAVAAVIVMPGRAMATPFPETWLADSSLHTYCFTAGFAASPDPTVGTYAMDVLDSTTDMFDSDYGTPCDDNTADVWWFSLNLAAGIRGEAQ
jgi:hypothetical protein